VGGILPRLQEGDAKKNTPLRPCGRSTGSSCLLACREKRREKYQKRYCATERSSGHAAKERKEGPHQASTSHGRPRKIRGRKEKGTSRKKKCRIKSGLRKVSANGGKERRRRMGEDSGKVARSFH